MTTPNPEPEGDASSPRPPESEPRRPSLGVLLVASVAAAALGYLAVFALLLVSEDDAYQRTTYRVYRFDSGTGTWARDPTRDSVGSFHFGRRAPPDPGAPQERPEPPPISVPGLRLFDHFWLDDGRSLATLCSAQGRDASDENELRLVDGGDVSPLPPPPGAAATDLYVMGTAASPPGALVLYRSGWTWGMARLVGREWTPVALSAPFSELSEVTVVADAFYLTDEDRAITRVGFDGAVTPLEWPEAIRRGNVVPVGGSLLASVPEVTRVTTWTWRFPLLVFVLMVFVWMLRRVRRGWWAPLVGLVLGLAFGGATAFLLLLSRGFQH